MRLNIEKRKNPFGSSETTNNMWNQEKSKKEIITINAGSDFAKFIPVKEKSPFGFLFLYNISIDEMMSGLQKSQIKHKEITEENFKTFYCHICMGNIGIFDELNDISIEPTIPSQDNIILEDMNCLVFFQAKLLKIHIEN